MKIQGMIDVTPELAAEWLSQNTRNRGLNKRTVANYARDMMAGKWEANGETIKRAFDGTLLDGQHRLAAVIESGVTVPLLVISGLNHSSQDTMDAGRKRSVQDALSIAGVANSATVAAVAKRVILWDLGDRKFGNNVQPTIAEVQAFIAENPSVHRSAEIGVRVRHGFKPIPQSTAGTAHQLFNRLDQDDTAQFFAQVETGANLAPGHPVLILRNRFMRDYADGNRTNDAIRLGLVIKAWNAFRAGETMSNIVMAKDTNMPEPI